MLYRLGSRTRRHFIVAEMSSETFYYSLTGLDSPSIGSSTAVQRKHKAPFPSTPQSAPSLLSPSARLSDLRCHVCTEYCVLLSRPFIT